MTEEDENLIRGLIYIAVALVAAWLALWVMDTGQQRGMAAVERLVVLESPSTHTTVVVEVIVPPVQLDGAASVSASATRGTQFQATPTLPPPPSTTSSTVPVAIPGDCASWVPIFAHFGATQAEIDFFIPRIIERESGCGRDTLNERGGDSGVCQIYPIHNRAGYFGGRYYGEGGWLHALHGLRTRENTDSIEWAASCLTLYRVCGSGPWQPPYSCLNRSYL